MTDIIQELRGLIAKATPGPWECDGAVLEYEGARFGEVAYVIGKAGQQFPAKAANAALIVAAINHLPALLDRLEAAERGWQPIETAPRDGTWFWAFWPVHTVEDQQQATSWQPWHAADWPRFCNSADSIDWCQPTHWRPLPDAPAIREVKP
ncbi:hypothetical protein ACKU27_05400 [Sphingobium yanoikuyae]|uniref:hypothetical protein n=1 Tax=Sphingobium yanoikuyae TaxID=13690 RepID=UPI003B904A8E